MMPLKGEFCKYHHCERIYKTFRRLKNFAVRGKKQLLLREHRNGHPYEKGKTLFFLSR